MSDELVDLVFDDAKDKMAKAVGHAKHEMAGVRTGRANSGLVEKLQVSYYGSDVPMQQLASFSVPEARLLVISPFDKASIGAIEKALQQSDLGLNPSNDGVAIRLAFPPLTEERRKEYVKLVKHMAEEGRVAIRGVRRHARQELEGMQKSGDLTEDEVARAEKELDKLTHAHEADVDAALGAKEQELLEV